MQCEREFHVGCLKKCGKCELDAVPEGETRCIPVPHSVRWPGRIFEAWACMQQCTSGFSPAATAASFCIPRGPPPPFPAGDWYCSEECERIRRLVGAAVQEQQMDIPGYPSHTWQVQRQQRQERQRRRRRDRRGGGTAV